MNTLDRFEWDGDLVARGKMELIYAFASTLILAMSSWRCAAIFGEIGVMPFAHPPFRAETKFWQMGDGIHSDLITFWAWALSSAGFYPDSEEPVQNCDFT
jgi:hypothetical protein